MNKPKALVAVLTLGCKLNQSESDSIATSLDHKGYHVLNREDRDLFPLAKYIVINTCTVTSKADRKSRHSIYQALKRNGLFAQQKDEVAVARSSKTDSHAENQKQGASPVLIVTGCFVGSAQEELRSLPIDYIVDNAKKTYIPEIIDSHEKNQILDYEKLSPDYFSYKASNTRFHTRNNLKIQDGCDNFCTFCIIPLVRGKAHSLPLKQVVQNARIMMEEGSKEIVLTGVNMSRYEDSSSKKSAGFSDLIEALLKLPNTQQCRFHISSLEPDTLDDRFFEQLQSPHLCSHLHLCLQSGSDKTLLKMRRMYNISTYMDCVDRIKQMDKDYNLTTDIIVGFPEESEEDFARSMSVAKEVGFSHIHIFPFSARTGTRALRMNPIKETSMKKRVRQLQELCDKQKKAYRLSMLEKKQTVLIERTSQSKDYGYGFGLSNYYIPFEVRSQNTETKKPQEHKEALSLIKKNDFITTTALSWKEEKDPVLLANLASSHIHERVVL